MSFEQSFEHYLAVHQRLANEGKRFVVATLVEVVGEAPNNVGARVIVGENEILFGTIGGGKLENRVILEARAELAGTAKPRKNFFHQWNLQKDLGMTCGGICRVYFEVFRPEARWSIVIFGAGHVSQALCRLLLNLDCAVTCIDNREEWLAKLPAAATLKKIHAPDMTVELAKVRPDSFVVLISMGHGTDSPLLIKALREHRFPYLGVMGSRVKSLRLRKDVLDAGLSPADTQRYFCPIGEDFGTNSPSEIAFSIVAQLLRERDRRLSSPVKNMNEQAATEREPG